MDHRESLRRRHSILSLSTRMDDGREVVVDCDEAFLDRLGYDRSDVEGESLATFADGRIPGPDGVSDARFLGEGTLVDSDGREVPAALFAAPSVEGDSVVGTDYTYVDLDGGRSEPGTAGAQRVLDAVTDLENCVSRADVYDAVVETAEAVLDAPCFAYRIDAGKLELAATSTGLDRSPVATVPLGEGPVGRAYGGGIRRGVDNEAGVEALGLDPATDGGAVCFPFDDYGVVVAVTGEDDLEAFGNVERLLSVAAGKLDRFAVFDDLVETKRRLLRLMSNVPGAVYQCANTPARETVFVTPDIEDLTGYGRQEFLDGRVSWEDDVVHPADRNDVFAAVEESVDSLEPYRETYRIVTKSGQERWVWDNGGGVYEDGEVVGLQGFITDVTERERHKQRLEVLNRVLRHNLRNNMNVIMGYAETLMNELGGEGPKMHANYIMEEAQELTELGDKARKIEQALDFEETAPDTIPIAETVGNKVSDFAERYPDADLRTELPDDELMGPPSVDYALENIIENAIVHNDRETPTVEVFVYASEGTHHDWTEVLVADDGPGIPDHEVRALLEGGETPLRHGSGLGLWLVNWIVKRSGGELQFDENEPRGSIVTMRFPRQA